MSKVIDTSIPDTEKIGKPPAQEGIEGGVKANGSDKLINGIQGWSIGGVPQDQLDCAKESY